ncbi:MAG: nucleotidyltransferase family protein [Kiritimatiellae bacterium]|nr:nucleotidyltransferase family protein [Kiritimatiellia bacterium]MCO5067495.1 nucleotidyltransferase family protein [Kiritimatiellia bacterium]
MTDSDSIPSGAPDLPRLLGALLRLEPVALAGHGVNTLLAEDDKTITQSLLRHGAGLKAAFRLMGQLGDRGIPHIFLKGPTLQRLLYGEAATRPYSDLDVLVQKENLPEAIEAATASGWKPPERITPYHFHVTCAPTDAPLPLELHTRWVDRANLYRLPDDAGFDRVCLGDEGLPRFCDEDLLLYLCVHAHKHGFLNETAFALGQSAEWFLSPASGNRLLWWLDIALLLERSDLDWKACTERIWRWNIIKPVAITLRMVTRFLPASKAREALARLKLDTIHPKLGRKAMRRMVIRNNKRFMSPNAKTWRPGRMAELPDLFFPLPDDLAAFLDKPAITLGDRLAHPIHMARRIFGK